MLEDIEQTEHVVVDTLHGELLTLLDRIETENDSTLASERFRIMEMHGYRVVLEDNLTKCCKAERQYSAQYDNYYCLSCYAWLEAGCSDPGCHYCPDRPPNAWRLHYG